MKTKIETRLLFFIIIFCIVFYQTGCKKKTNTEEVPNNPSLTELEWQAIIKDDSIIKLTADSSLLSNNPPQGWQKKLNYYNSLLSVEQAWIVDSTALFIKFKKAGVIFWDYQPKLVSRHEAIFNNEKIENSLLKKGIQDNGNVCLINTWYDDQDAWYTINFIEQLQSTFQNNNYNVTIKNGSSADVKFFRDDLKGYKVIYIIGHGKYERGCPINLEPLTWIQTGEEGNMWDIELGKYTVEWLIGKIALGHHKEKRNGVDKEIYKFSVSENFFNDEYTSNDFPNTLIYLANCETFKDPNKKLAKTFNTKGAGVTVGWDETHWLGNVFREQGVKLLDTMSNAGIDFNTAFNILANDQNFETFEKDGTIITSYLTYQSWNNITSHLVYYPSSGGTIQLTFKPQLLTPVNGYTTSSLTPTLTCQPYTGATNYKFQVATESNFNNIIVNANSSSCQYQIANGILVTNTQYFWRVKATISNGSSPWSDAWSFTASNGIPSNVILPLAVGNYWTYLPDITTQTVTISITGTIDIQGETCYKWFAQGDQFEWYYKNKSDGCWAYGYSGPYQYPPDLEYKYPANSGDTWITNWIAVPVPTTMTCESTNVTFESYTGCYKYHFLLPMKKDNFCTNMFKNELLKKMSGLKTTATDGYDIYQYFVPGIGMVGWANYFQGTRLYKVVLTDYHLN